MQTHTRTHTHTHVNIYPVFAGLEGKWVCLHVGQRTYPDGGKHREIMRRDGGAARCVWCLY